MDFQKEVVERSKEQPVLVDFWAEWCGPCKFLGPILEELEAGQKRWKLVKVDVDANPEISRQFEIRGIPDVRLFIDGEEAGQFTGAKPKHEVEKWLNDLIPDERIEVLNRLVEKSGGSDSFEELESFVKDNPDLDVGRVALAKLILWENPQAAGDLVVKIHPTNKLFDDSRTITALANFMTNDLPENSSPVSAKMLELKQFLSEKALEAGIKVLIDIVTLDKSFQNNLPVRIGASLFNFLGPDDELTKTYRRKFDMALY